MSPNDYDASVLAVPYADGSPDRSGRNSTGPTWTRRSADSGSRRSHASDNTRQADLRSRALHSYRKVNKQVMGIYKRLTPLQRAALGLLGVLTLVVGILFLVYNEKILKSLEPYAEKWRALPGGWAILWAMTFFVSFPPLIGYSSCVTISGFVFGFPNGWFIVASATILGSTAAFIVSRSVLKNLVERLVRSDARFASLALTLKHDGLKLLVMIRLCPLPYSFSNGAISMIPTVKALPFMFATAVVSPKLMLHVFVGAQLAKIAKSGDKMDAKTKAISYLSIAIGIAAGTGTGWVIYRQTKKRAAQLEAEERNAARSESRDELRREYADDPEALEAAEALRDGADDISLRTADDYDEDGDDAWEEEGQRDSGYRDELDDDAREMGDVFSEGDADEDAPPPAGRQK